MAENGMDLLELHRKRGMDSDVDFLREALQVLVEGTWTPRWRPRSAPSVESAPRPRYPPQRLPQPALGHSGRYHGVADPQDPEGQLFPKPVGSRSAQPKGSAQCSPASLRGGGVHQEGGRSDKRYGLRWHIKSQVSRICRDLYQVVENFRPDPWTAVLIPLCGWTRDLRRFEKVVALSTSARGWLPTLLGNGAALPTYNSHPRMCKPTPTRCWPSSESAFPRPLR